MGLEILGFNDDHWAPNGVALYAPATKPTTYTGRTVFTIPAKTVVDSIGSVTVPATPIDITGGISYWSTNASNSLITNGFPDYDRGINTSTADGHKYKLTGWLLFDASWQNSGGVLYYTLTETSDSPIDPSYTSWQIHSPSGYYRTVFVFPLFVRYDWTVTFNANGGSVSTSSKVVMRGQAYGDLPTPTLAGCRFDGWFTAASGGTQVTSSTVFALAGDQTLYAHWTGIQAVALLDPQGGVISGNYFVRTTGGQPYGALPTPTRAGYTFDGWFTAATGGAQVTAATICAATTTHTLYARWSRSAAPAHTVRFNAMGGTVSESARSVLEGSALGTLPTPTRTGYTFVGWFTSSAGGTQITAATVMGDDDIYACAVWSQGTITVTFNANGGTVTEATRTVSIGGQYQRLPIPTWNGHNFDGWFTAATGGTQITAATTVTSTVNQTLYAHWSNGTVSWWGMTFS